MTDYVVGDVQGCYDELISLCNKIKFDKKKDKLIFAGDLVNRGPKSLAVLNFCLENNYYISISGIITFKNASNLRDIIRDAPLDSILIETDSPFLAPEPMRGKVNEPSFVKYTAEYLAKFFKLSLEEFERITDNNFFNLFKKAKRDNYL